MNTLCTEPLLGGQCCFQGTLSSIEIQGKRDAVFISPEALGHPQLNTLRFSPPVTIERGNESIKNISLLPKPDDIDALPWVPNDEDPKGPDLGYRVSYRHTAPEPKLSIQLYLDSPVDTRDSMTLNFSGPIPNHGECKSTDACKLIWSSSQDFGVVLEHRGEGLGQIAEGFPTNGLGATQRVLRAKLEIQSGSLRCVDESGKAFKQKAPPTLEWEAGSAPHQARSLQVGGISLDKDGLHTEVVAMGLQPKDSPPRDSPPKDSPMSLVLPLSAGLALVALALSAWGLWRYAKTKKAKQSVYIAYAPEDKELLLELEQALQKGKCFHIVYAGQLDEPSDNAQPIAAQMEQADIVLLLLSADFLASDALWEQTQAAIRLHREHNKRLVKLYARPCYVEMEPYSEMESLPKDKRAISLLKPGAQRWKDSVEALLRGPDRD